MTAVAKVAKQVLRGLARGILWAWRLLWRSEVPLIVTVGLAALAAFLAPQVTEKFERQRLSAEYVLNNLKDLNTLIAEIYVDVSKINYAVAAGNPPPRATRDHARETLAKLNWKIVETAAMLPKAQRVVLHEFQTDVFRVSQNLDEKLDIEGCQRLLKSVDAMGLSGARSIQTVGRHVDLSNPPEAEAEVRSSDT